MVENEKNEKVALDYMGRAFVKVPRTLLYKVYYSKGEEKMLAKLHLALFVLCNYEDRTVDSGGQKVFCLRGDYVGTYRRLSELTGLPFGSISRLLNVLQKRGLIEIRRVLGGTSIRINGYDRFTFLSEAKESIPADNGSKAATNADAAARMSDAEAKIGGRSKQYSDNKNN